MPRINIVDLREILATEEWSGVVWTLEQGDDVNVNLVRFSPGRGVGEHVNEEVDVLVIGVSGSGVVAVDGYEHQLRAGTVAFVPKGARRSTRSEFGGLRLPHRPQAARAAADWRFARTGIISLTVRERWRHARSRRVLNRRW